MRRLYWQLILPRDEHLLTPPEGFAGEQTWTWTGCCWGRRPLLDQAQLENWVGVRQRASPAGQVNEYLFSAFGNVDRCVVHTAGRSWIVLAASGAALLAGLLLIYVRRLSHPAVLLSATVLLAAAGMVYPEPAGLAAQAAVLGLALALVAADPRCRPRAAAAAAAAAAGREGQLRAGARAVAGNEPTSPAGRRRLDADAESAGRAASFVAVAGHHAMKPCALAVLVTTWLALLTASAAAAPPDAQGAGAAKEEGGQPLRFRRVFAPADRMTDWPRGEWKYLPIDAAEFERLLSSVRNAAAGAGAPSGVRIVMARYTARWEAAQTLRGEATWEIAAAGGVSALLALDPCNLALGKARWLGADPAPPAVLGSDDDGKLRMLVERPGRRPPPGRCWDGTTPAPARCSPSPCPPARSTN